MPGSQLLRYHKHRAFKINVQGSRSKGSKKIFILKQKTCNSKLMKEEEIC